MPLSDASPPLSDPAAPASLDPTAAVILTSEQIQGLLPHRYPFALVDRVIEHEPGKRAVAIKNVTLNEPQFQGHFPGRPLMPGVLIVEAMAQVGRSCPGLAVSLLLEEAGLVA